MEKEKSSSSRRHKESYNRDRESSPRDHKYRSRDISDDDDDYQRRHRHHRSSKHRDDSDSRRRRSVRELSVERERSSDREGSRDRYPEESYVRERSFDREKSSEREGSVETRHHSSSSSRLNKRKERAESEERSGEGGEKRARVSEQEKKENRKKEKRRYEDGNVKENREEMKERRRFEDGRVKKENVEVDEGRRERALDENVIKKETKNEPIDSEQNGAGSSANGAAMGPASMTSRNYPETSMTSSHPPDTKVSYINTTNENKGVNINRSHEVPGKSSTDGTASDAGKSGGLSLDALAKAKRALQMQKELAEKLKKIPSLNKGIESSREGSPQVRSKEGLIASSSPGGILPTPVPSATGNAHAGVMASSSAVPTPASSMDVPPSGLAHLPGLTAQKYEAIKRAQELAAKMGFRQDPQFAPLINMFPGQMPPEVSIQPKPAKAPVLRLDALGREVDEHGNVVNVPKLNNLSTLKVNINKQKKDAFQILKPELEVDPEKNPFFDPGMGINKNKILRPKRMSFQFVEEGKWSKDAEIIKLKNQFGEARAKELKAKQAQFAKAKAEPDINPNLIEVSERIITKEKPKEPIPETEWWDSPFLKSGTYGDIVGGGSMTADMLKMDKITLYVEHPRPIEPPAEPAPPPPQPLKLTKKEQKKLRTQRRLAREKEKQEMIRQGLIEPPKPKVKMSNLMKVLGSEATQDPTKLEMEIRSAAAEREQAHIDRNIARKLTPSERREKKERKLFDDPSTLETIVSVYKVFDLSHPQTRFKVDINAQENRLTGCAVISEGITVVVVEGGNKSIKRYNKLMLRRIDWAAAVKIDEDEGEDEEKPVNKCMLVWQGSVAKPSFTRFTVHDCRTEAAARKVFSDAGVAHYWELAVNFTEDQI